MRNLRTAFLASAAIIAVAGAHTASAGGMVAAPAYSWSGCYAGAQVGWGWGHSSFQDSFYTNVAAHPASGGAWYYVDSGLIDNFLGMRSVGVNQSGGLFGGQVGCDYQFTHNPAGANLVIGISASAAGADISGTGQDPYIYSSGNAETGQITAKNDFLADISGRVGIAWQQFLLYGKGGVAWAHNQYTTDTYGGYTTFGCLGCYNLSGAFAASDTVTGGLAGAGVSVLLGPNWTAFAEYNHYFLPTRELNFTANGVGTFGEPLVLQANVFVKQSIDTVKVGVNYRFMGW